MVLCKNVKPWVFAVCSLRRGCRVVWLDAHAEKYGFSKRVQRRLTVALADEKRSPGLLKHVQSESECNIGRRRQSAEV